MVLVGFIPMLSNPYAQHRPEQASHKGDHRRSPRLFAISVEAIRLAESCPDASALLGGQPYRLQNATSPASLFNLVSDLLHRFLRTDYVLPHNALTELTMVQDDDLSFAYWIREVVFALPCASCARAKVTSAKAFQANAAPTEIRLRELLRPQLLQESRVPEEQALQFRQLERCFQQSSLALSSRTYRTRFLKLSRRRALLQGAINL